MDLTSVLHQTRDFPWIAVGLGVAVFYFIPTFIALFRRHPAWKKIAAANVMSGWMWIGWVAVAAWALKPKIRTDAEGDQ